MRASSSNLAIPESKYQCITQESLPIRPATGGDPLSIWVSWGGRIPRWKKGQVVQFPALAGGYPTPNHAIFAAYKPDEAAIQWNRYNVGVTFK